MKKTALLVIDVQKGLVEEGPYEKELFISNLKQLITASRQAKMEVIYVRHCEAEGLQLAPGSPDWHVYKEIAPAPGEMIIDKYFSSAFRKTNLKDYLNIKDITQLIVTGMQTEYCVDATIKVAFEYGYDLVIPKMCNTTFDNGDIKAEDIVALYNERIYDHRFGSLESVDYVIESIIK